MVPLYQFILSKSIISTKSKMLFTLSEYILFCVCAYLSPSHFLDFCSLNVGRSGNNPALVWLEVDPGYQLN